MTTRRRPVSGTADWTVLRPRPAALVSARAVVPAGRRLEDAPSTLDLTGRVSARARGIVRAFERAD